MRPGLNQNFFLKSSQNIPVRVQVVIFWGSILLCIRVYDPLLQMLVIMI